MKSSIFLAFAMVFFFPGCANRKVLKTQKIGTSEINDYSANNPIINKYWKVISLNGKKVTMAKNQQRELYFTLKTEDNRVAGFSRCNQFSGTYTLLETGKIHFSQMLSTMMACPDVAVNESEFLKVFSITNSYKIVGDTLWLEQEGKKQMATFAAIYFR